MDDDLLRRFETSLVLPSRKSEKDQLLDEEGIKRLFDRWKQNKTSHALRILKETLIARKMQETPLALEIYDLALDFYSENEQWAEFLATASHHKKFKTEGDLISVIIDPLNINGILESNDQSLFWILSRNYYKMENVTCSRKQLETFIKISLESKRAELVNKGIIR
jgi:hypothetical protein